MTFTLYLATGIPLFIGAACCAAVPLLGRCRGRVGAASILLLVVGVLLIALSATPTPWPVTLVGAACAAGWLVTRRKAETRAARAHAACGGLLALAAIGTAAFEFPHVVTPHLPAGDARMLVVVGDSLSAGIGDGVTTWPAILAAEHGIEARNLASAGATTAAAWRQANAIPETAGVVVVLIGGNDYLQGRPAADFERDLASLLKRVAAPARRIVMFELPVLPGGNLYLAAQRRVADEQGVTVIPRHRLAIALAGRGATSDGLHLSPVGQAAVARVTWDVIGPAFSHGAADAALTPAQNPKADSLQNRPGDVDAPPLTTTQATLIRASSAPGDRLLRIATWNVQKCAGGVEAIIDRLKAIDADVLCLQELVGPSGGSGSEDQTQRIARALSMHVHSDCGRLDDTRVQCIAILSKSPLRDAESLRTAEDRAYGVAARLDGPTGPLCVVCVHLAGTWRFDAGHVAETTARREAECEALAAWVRGVRGEGSTQTAESVVIAGDFNPVSGECLLRLGGVLTPASGIGPTFPSSEPILQLDRLFFSPGVVLRSVRLDDSLISDHRTAVVEFGARANSP